MSNRSQLFAITLLTLGLHRTDTAVLRRTVSSKIPPSVRGDWKTHRKENPLKHLTVIFWLFRHIEPEFVFGVIVLSKVKQNGGRLEDREAFRSGRGWSIPVH